MIYLLFEEFLGLNQEIYTPGTAISDASNLCTRTNFSSQMFFIRGSAKVGKDDLLSVDPDAKSLKGIEFLPQTQIF